MRNMRINQELFDKCIESKRIPRKLKKYMKSMIYSIDMHVGTLDLLGPYAKHISAFDVIELMKDIERSGEDV